MINRRVTRVVLNTTEVTDALVKPNSTPLTTALLTTDFLYVGFHGRFASRYFQVGTVNAVVSTLTAQFWDGTNWVAVDDLVDQTSLGGAVFAQSGFISWQNKDNWVQRSITGIDTDIELYWIRFSVSVNLTGTTSLRSVLNIFSDDAMLTVYAPELISDANYLPSGKTNFLDQHVAAKDYVVLRLKTRKAIDDESQVIDINNVSMAAVYACAWLILAPIATSDASKELRDTMKAAFEEEVSKVTFAVDQNGDGQVDESEREQVTSFFIERR